MNDKIAHLIIGATIGAMVFTAYYVISGNYRNSMYAALTIGICLGGYKEYLDITGGTVDLWDFVVTVQGSLLGGIISGGILNIKTNKR